MENTVGRQQRGKGGHVAAVMVSVVLEFGFQLNFLVLCTSLCMYYLLLYVCM